MKVTKKISVAFISVVMVVLVVVIGASIYSNSAAVMEKKQLDLGQKYLDNLDYEKAIASFEAVIKIDPMNTEAYLGISEAYVGLNNLNKALEITKEGYEATGNGELRNKIKEIEELIEQAKKDALGKLLDNKVIDVNDYESFGMPYGGVIPVKNNGKWGAINYQNEQIVPYEYTDFHATANEKGYFVLSNGEEQRTYYLFDSTGKIIYQGEYIVSASGNCYCLLKYDPANEEMYDYSIENKIEYYDYDGKRFLTTYNVDASLIRAYSSVDGKMLVYNGEYLGQETEVINHANGNVSTTTKDMVKLKMGYIYEDNSVEWVEKPFYEGECTSRSEEKLGGFTTFSTGGTDTLPRSPISSTNRGYYVVSLRYGEWGTPHLMYNEANEFVAEWDLTCAMLVDGELVFDEDIYSYHDNDNSYIGYFHDGKYLYNYGSKMVWYVGGKCFLVDMSLCSGMTEETMSNDIVVASYDYISMSNEKYWLVQKGEQWGYIDHEGNEVMMYDDATEFRNGYALIIENGMVKVVDEEFNVIQEVEVAESVYLYGDLFCIEKDETKILYQWKAE